MILTEYLHKLKTASDKDKLELIKLFSTFKTDTELINTVLYALHSLSKFSNQIQFIDAFVLQVDDCIKEEILQIIIKEWRNITTDRKDKYYYLIDKIADKRLSTILKLICDSEIKIFLIKRSTVDIEIQYVLNYMENEADLGIIHCLANYIPLHYCVENEVDRIRALGVQKDSTEARRRLFCRLYEQSKHE